MPTPRSSTRTVPTTKYKARHYTKPAFTIPSKVRIEDGRLYIPKRSLGPIQGYAASSADRPRTAGVESTAAEVVRLHRVRGAGRPPRVCRPAETGAVGIDRNVGQATSTGEVHALPDTTVEDQDQAVSAGWPGSRRAPNAAAGPAANCANCSAGRPGAGTTAPNQTNTAQPSCCEHQGHRLKQKAGLSPSWRPAGDRAQVRVQGRRVSASSRPTSQACSQCGHTAKSNRPSQAVFACGACGFQANADHNAAINILVRAGLPPVPVPARGTGAAARRGALPPWSVARPTTGTPATREPDMRGVNHCI